MADADVLQRISDDEILLEVARHKVQEVLVELRNSRVSVPLRNNGLVIREHDGTRSDTIRLGPEDAVRIGLRAIAAHLATL